MTLDAYQATVTMVDHFASAEEARAVVEPFLRTWEFSCDLHQPGDRFRFQFVNANVVDRNPPPGGSNVILAGVGASSILGAGVVIHIGRGRWPDPPERIALSPDTEFMRHRWLAYQQGQEPLMSAAYWALTMLEATGKAALGGPSRRAACDYYNVHKPVLDKLGELTDAKGGLGARKAKGRYIPLASSEEAWVVAAFRRLVLRAAEQAYHGGPPPQQLTMADLPDLS